MKAIERAGYTPGSQVAIALDIAASEFGRGGKYKLALDDKELDSDGMIKLLSGWIRRYPIVSIEDPLAEDDGEGFAAFTRELGRARAGGGRRFPGLAGVPRARSEAAWRGERRAVEAESARHADRDVRRVAGREGSRVRWHRIGAVGRDRGCDHRASRRGLGCGAAQSRQLRAQRADGEVERDAAHRGGVGRARPVRRRGCAGTFAPSEGAVPLHRGARSGGSARRDSRC